MENHTTASAESVRRLIPLVIILLSVLAFLPALQNGFVDWDDSANLIGNSRYRGLGWTELRWMFSTLHMSNYRPLAWMTFGMDYVLWGMEPFGYHLTNLLFHAANAVVVYFIALRLLRLGMPVEPGEVSVRLGAGFAALLFAIHPLRVETVAWASARNDVVSGLFYLLTILFYLRANAGAQTVSGRRRWMMAALASYSLSLLGKGFGITLPVVLLVLDVYPLRRLQDKLERWFKPPGLRVWLEKIPFLLLGLMAGIVALIAKEHSDALTSIARLGLLPRLSQSSFGLAFYLWKTVVPVALSPLYEIPVRVDPWDWLCVLSGVVVVAVSLSLFVFRQRWPAGLAIWTSYVVILAPVLGIAQSGPQFVADRYSYLPCVGLALLAGAGAVSFLEHWNNGKIGKGWFAFAAVSAAVTLILLPVMTWRQTRVWHDSETLYRYIIAVTEGTRFQPSYAHGNLAALLQRRGELTEAVKHYRRAVEINPSDEKTHYNLGNALSELGHSGEAMEQYRLAVLMNPANVQAQYNLAVALDSHGDSVKAIEHYRRALELDPRYALAHNNLGVALAERGELVEAIKHFRRALEIDPGYVEARNNLRFASDNQSQLNKAIGHHRHPLRVQSQHAEAHDDLGHGLAQQGKNIKAGADPLQH